MIGAPIGVARGAKEARREETDARGSGLEAKRARARDSRRTAGVSIPRLHASEVRGVLSIRREDDPIPREAGPLRTTSAPCRRHHASISSDDVSGPAIEAPRLENSAPGSRTEALISRSEASWLRSVIRCARSGSGPPRTSTRDGAARIRLRLTAGPDSEASLRPGPSRTSWTVSPKVRRFARDSYSRPTNNDDEPSRFYLEVGRASPDRGNVFWATRNVLPPTRRVLWRARRGALRGGSSLISLEETR
jgi:hypothetical protein